MVGLLPRGRYLVLLSASLLAPACGGPAKPATPPGGATTDPATTASAATDTPPDSREAPTTTTQLPNNGEIQGGKLGSSTHTSATTVTKHDRPKTPDPGRSVDDIRTIILARRDRARACYDNALRDHPNIEGDLDIKWVIDPDGNVTDIEVDTTKSSILEPDVSSCIIAIIKDIKFSKSPRGYETRTHYPFNFHPKQAPRR